MKHKLYGLAASLIAIVLIPVFSGVHRDLSQLPLVLMIAMAAAVPAGVYTAWSSARMELNLREDAPDHDHAWKLWFNGAELCFVCTSCGRRREIRRKYRLLAETCVFAPALALSWWIEELCSNAGEVIAAAARITSFLCLIILLQILVNGLMYLWLRRKDCMWGIG